MKNNILIITTLFLSINALLGQNCKTYQQTHAVNYIDVSPNGKYIISCDYNKENTVKLIDYETGKITKQFLGHIHGLSRVSFSHDSKYIVSGSYGGIIMLWDIRGNLVRSFEGHKKAIVSVCFSSDGKYILSSSKDKTIKLWDIETGGEVRSFTNQCKHNSYANFSPDNKYIIGGGHYKKKMDKGLSIWNISNGELEYSFKLDKIGGGTPYFSPDGKSVIGAGSFSKHAYLLEFPSGKLIEKFVGHTNWIYNFKFSPNMKYLFSCSEDKTIKIWDIESGKMKYTFNGHTGPIVSIGFSSDYKYLVSGSLDKTIKIWDIPKSFNLID